MRYLGGKSRYGQVIAELIPRNKPIYEPFCGALWVTQYLCPVIASDIDEYLICLYNEIRNGWEPPDHISEQTYKDLREQAKEGVISPEIAFVGYACSWAGKWFGGYARGENRNFCLESKKTLISKMKCCKDVIFKHLNYLNLNVTNSTIYCDPIYVDTTSHRKLWDTGQFWKWAREQVGKGNELYVSEYVAPSDFVPIKKFDHFSTGTKHKTVEYVFKHESQNSFEEILFSL